MTFTFFLSLVLNISLLGLFLVAAHGLFLNPLTIFNYEINKLLKLAILMLLKASTKML